MKSMARRITLLGMVMWSLSAVKLEGASQLAYISNNMNSTVSVIDTGTNAVVATIPIDFPPGVVVLSPAGNRLYVVKSDPNFVANTPAVEIFDTLTRNKIGSITNAALLDPDVAAISPDGNRLYVADFELNTLNVVNLKSP